MGNKGDLGGDEKGGASPGGRKTRRTGVGK